MRDRRFVFLGLSITSSWGNGHASTYRGLVRELARRGHDVLFLERDVPWYRENRDAPRPEGCRLGLYADVEELKRRYGDSVRDADVVIVGSYVPDGVAVGDWVTSHARGLTAFYDIDTPVTLAKLQRKDHEYLTPGLIRRYGLYLSFTGGPTLDYLEKRAGSPAARHLPCGADTAIYGPRDLPIDWDLGYLGTYSDDRQPTLERLLIDVALSMPERRFVVAGPSYPPSIPWPTNVERIEHVAPSAHAAFYARQRFTLNVTRRDMISAGWSPSVRLFEAGACAVPVISDRWDGIDRYFEPGREIVLVDATDEVVRVLGSTSDAEARALGRRIRQRVLEEHTAEARAQQLEGFVEERLAVRGAAE